MGRALDFIPDAEGNIKVISSVADKRFSVEHAHEIAQIKFSVDLLCEKGT